MNFPTSFSPFPSALRRLCTVLSVAFFVQLSAFAQDNVTPSQAQGQVATINAQINQMKIDIESQKLLQLQAKAQKQPGSEQMAVANIKRIQNTMAIRQLELAMWQQQVQFEKQPLSADRNVSPLQLQIRQITIEKLRLGIQQRIAEQSGNKNGAQTAAQQIANLQSQLVAKQQEIRLAELKAKAAALPR